MSRVPETQKFEKMLLYIFGYKFWFGTGCVLKTHTALIGKIGQNTIKIQNIQHAGLQKGPPDLKLPFYSHSLNTYYVLSLVQVYRI